MRVLALSAVLLLAACADEVGMDYREKHAIGVSAETVALAALVSGPSLTLAAEDEARLHGFVAAYIDQGNGPLTAVARLGADTQVARTQAVTLVQERLAVAGVPLTAMRIVVTDADVSALTLSYTRYVAVVPTCGDWSAPPTRNANNDVLPNFGCALQRDIGLMVADPADLARPRTSAPTDAATASRTVQQHREGKSPAGEYTPMYKRDWFMRSQ